MVDALIGGGSTWDQFGGAEETEALIQMDLAPTWPFVNVRFCMQKVYPIGPLFLPMSPSEKVPIGINALQRDEGNLHFGIHRLITLPQIDFQNKTLFFSCDLLSDSKIG
jgi:hypothetical protein